MRIFEPMSLQLTAFQMFATRSYNLSRDFHARLAINTQTMRDGALRVSLKPVLGRLSLLIT